MCQFKSAVVTRTGEVYHSPYTSSHEDIIKNFKLKGDDKAIQNFVRIEFVPFEKEFEEIEKYQLIIDEQNTPEWFIEIQDEIIKKMKKIIKAMLIKEKKSIVLGGEWIVCSLGIVSKNIGGNIHYNYGTVNDNYGTVDDNYGTVKINYNSGTVKINYNSGTVNHNSGTVDDNSGTVNDNSGTVNYNYGTVNDNSGTVNYNSGTVNDKKAAVL
jgi:hypothetical protein